MVIDYEAIGNEPKEFKNNSGITLLWFTHKLRSQGLKQMRTRRTVGQCKNRPRQVVASCVKLYVTLNWRETRIVKVQEEELIE